MVSFNAVSLATALTILAAVTPSSAATCSDLVKNYSRPGGKCSAFQTPPNICGAGKHTVGSPSVSNNPSPGRCSYTVKVRCCTN
ncbi:hypothetical protein M3J09_006084 [Ascochyta lentis]